VGSMLHRVSTPPQSRAILPAGSTSVPVSVGLVRASDRDAYVVSLI